MTIAGWIIIDEPPAPPLATQKETAWVWINEASNQADLEIRHCNEQQRAHVPVEVIEALLAAWRARSVTKP